eukprot:gene11757-12976_t
MQARKRFNVRKDSNIIYSTLLLFLLILTLLFFVRRWWRMQDDLGRNSTLRINAELDALPVSSTHNNDEGLIYKEADKLSSTQIQCRMESCFNFGTACRKNGFKVYVTPMNSKPRIKSSVYLNILKSIKRSSHFTSDPSSACLFVLSIDTIDRDILSIDFVKDLPSFISKSDVWNRGRNFLLFNLFSGTWPNYTEHLGFNFGHAMLARASFSEDKFRQGFDVSFPLFKKDHPFVSRRDYYKADLFPLQRRYHVAFKGKRYLFGIGSEVRDALHLVNNNDDVVLLTTCRHSKNWEKYQDSRCQADNENFDRYDYHQLLHNSTFCLVPRGRRLGSFRFLEALQAGCIPVVMSDGWELPFADVIDWSRAVLKISERMLLQMPVMLRSISQDRILSMRQQGYFLYAAYFSSVEQMVHTTLEIVHDRVEPYNAHSYHMWNYPPGALSAHTGYSTKLSEFPFYYNLLGSKPQEKFTAILLAVSAVRYRSCNLFKLIETLGQSQHLDQILIVWLPSANIPDKTKWPKTRVPLRVVYPGLKNMNSKFLDSKLIKTDAVFTLDEDVVVTKDDVDFAFRTWLAFPDRLVGYTTRDHYWDPAINSWMYTSRISNTFSMISLSAAVYHRYYNSLYFKYMPKEVWQLVTKLPVCKGLAMNFLVSQVIGKPPIKVAHSSHFNPGEPFKEIEVSGREKPSGRKYLAENLKRKQYCFRELSRMFGRVTLMKSNHKLDPLLYLDPISNFRKRYRFLEWNHLRN